MAASSAGVRNLEELEEIAANASGWVRPAPPIILTPISAERSRVRGAFPVRRDDAAELPTAVS